MNRMNLVYGEIVGLFEEGGMRMGKIRVGGAIMTNAAVGLLVDPRPGDSVLLCDGVVIGKVQEVPVDGEGD